MSALRASFLVANHIAKARKPFTTGEELILHPAKDMCHELLGEAAVQKVAHIPLSASTITRLMDEIAEHIEAQLLERINESPWYTIQVDKSTNVDLATMFVLCDIFFRRLYTLLPTTTIDAELFKSLNDHLSGKPNWSFCVSMCADGAAGYVHDWTAFWFPCSSQRDCF